MSLKIDLKPGEKFIINGAVLTAGKRRVSLVLENKAVLLRAKDIMQESEADTPAKRIYFAIMLMYIGNGEPAYRERFLHFLNDYLEATTLREVRAILLELKDDVENGRFYQAMRSCKELIGFEARVLKLGAVPIETAKETATAAEVTR
jgi:flagellar biosynthesis repressor protein FlbT